MIINLTFSSQKELNFQRHLSQPKGKIHLSHPKSMSVQENPGKNTWGHEDKLQGRCDGETVPIRAGHQHRGRTFQRGKNSLKEHAQGWSKAQAELALGLGRPGVLRLSGLSHARPDVKFTQLGRAQLIVKNGCLGASELMGGFMDTGLQIHTLLLHSLFYIVLMILSCSRWVILLFD